MHRPSRLRRLGLPVAATAAGLVAVPALAYAASDSFSSSSSTTPAVRATNSGTGLAVDATAEDGTALQSRSRGDGSGSAIAARSYATGARSNGLYAKSYATSGEHYGAWGLSVSPDGAGVFGQNTSPDGGLGVVGEGTDVGVLGSGEAYGVLASSDLGALGHAVDANSKGGNWAGECTVPAGSTAAPCTFADPVPGDLKPVVVLTPQGDPGGAYWVVPATDGTGFTIRVKTAPAAAVRFGWQAVSFVNPAVSPAGSSHAAAARQAQTATR